MIRNKRGGEKYLSPWNFVVWVFIAGVVVAGLSLFNSAQINVKQDEAKTLALRLVDCLIKDGNLNPEFLEKEFDIYKECSLNKAIMDKNIFYAKINFKNLETNSEIMEPIILGDKDLAVQCELKSTEEHFALCYKEKIYTLKDNGDLIITILTASNNKGS